MQCLTRKAFNILLHFIFRQKVVVNLYLQVDLTIIQTIRQFTQQKSAERAFTIQNNVFQRWQRSFLVNKLIFQKGEVRKAQLLTSKFGDWKANHRLLVNTREILKEADQKTAKKYLVHWKRFTSLEYNYRIKKVVFSFFIAFSTHINFFFGKFN